MTREHSMKVLIPIDGTETAQRAVVWVAQTMEGGRSADVVLLNVRRGPQYMGELEPLEYEAIERREREQQQKLLRKALEHARSVGVTQVAIEAATGSPGDEIARVASERGVDQIVMGTHGRGVAGALFLGSVAQRVAQLAPMPVTLVK
jgi:nucleotide-binding universal stress UspA family protein